MAEPYQQLDSDTRDRAIAVLLDWAIRQKSRRRPFLEFLDGSTLTPQDLLVEPPPSERVSLREVHPTLSLGLQIQMRRVQLLLQPRRPRAWTRVLNLIAVSATHGEDDVNLLLDQIAGRAEAEGSAGVPAL